MLAETFRVNWVSLEARKVWEPRILRIQNMWNFVERYKGISIQTLLPMELASISRACIEKGFNVLPYKNVGISSVAEKPGNERVRAIIYAENRFSAAQSLLKALDEGNNHRIGEILEYPTCCNKFFCDNWGVKHDLIPLMLDGNITSCNMMLRAYGLRAVSHLPCSFGCSGTRIIAHENWVAADALGFHKEFIWLLNILGMPMKYSQYHGAAIIETPLFRVLTDTDYTEKEKVLEFHGCHYPLEGASGNSFPFIRREVNEKSYPDNFYYENGFRSYYSMNTAHEVIRQLIKRDYVSIVDFGCGNGYLLYKIREDWPHVKFIGIDINEGSLESAKSVFPGLETHNMEARNFDKECSLGIMSINRILENRAVTPMIHMNCRSVIFYTYEGKSLTSLLSEARIDTVNSWRIVEHIVKGINAAILLERI